MKYKPSKKLDNHDFRGRVCHWIYCLNCGLVALRNEETQYRIKKGCDA